MVAAVRIAWIVGLAACALAPSLAVAQAAVPEALPSGATLPGRVLAVHVGVDVVVQRPDGSVVTVPWADLTVTPSTDAPVHVRVTAGPPDAETRSDPIEEFSRTRRPGDVPLVVLSDGAPLMVSAIDGADPSTRNDTASATNGWAPAGLVTHTLCTTPCTLYTTPAGHTLFVGGPSRLFASTTVTVAPSGSRVVLRSTHVLRPVGALAALAIGIPFSIAGPALAGFGVDGEMHGGVVSGTCGGSVGSSAGGYASSTNCDAGVLLATGGVMAAAGAALVVTGILLAIHSRTGVEREEPLDGIPLVSTRHGTTLRLVGMGVTRTEDGRGAVGAVGFTF